MHSRCLPSSRKVPPMMETLVVVAAAAMVVAELLPLPGPSQKEMMTSSAHRPMRFAADLGWFPVDLERETKQSLNEY